MVTQGNTHVRPEEGDTPQNRRVGVCAIKNGTVDTTDPVGIECSLAQIRWS